MLHLYLKIPRELDVFIGMVKVWYQIVWSNASKDKLGVPPSSCIGGKR